MQRKRSSARVGRVLIWSLILTATLLAGLACGGDEGQDDADSTPTGTGDTEAPTVSVDAQAGTFEELAAAYVNGVDGTVTYKVESDNFGFHPVGTWATYRLGTDIREDWTTNTFGYDETTTAINAASSGMVLCTRTPFTTSCTAASELGELDAVLILFTPIKELPRILLTDETVDWEASDLPDETIADVDARCFQISIDGRIGTGPPGTEEIKMCFSQEGTLLVYDRIVNFESASFEPAKLSAIAQSTGESLATDFDPPVPPAQLGN